MHVRPFVTYLSLSILQFPLHWSYPLSVPNLFLPAVIDLASTQLKFAHQTD